jgi:hypothetical protein
VPPIVHDALRSPSEPLKTGTRTAMESRFGHDFSQVRVHTDARSAESARVLNAHAYTVGQDIVFGAGQYAPSTPKGERLLAHELVHTDAPNIVNGPLILDTSRNSPAEAIAKRASAGEISSPTAVAATHRMPAGGRVIRRQAVDAGAPAASFYSSLSSGDYEGAVRYLSALSEPDMRAELRVLPVDTRGRLRDAALRLDPSGTSPVVRVIEDIENNNPPKSAVHQPHQLPPFNQHLSTLHR